MTDTLDRLRNGLIGRYTIEREIGAGGMATVYLAHDVRHKRRVAVKVLRPELAASLGAERFLREIETAARLHHPHIVPVHDSGEADGLLFYVMPFIEGQALRDRLTREGELPISDALRILHDVVDALSEAHAHRVVHRDIKPENVLLQGRHAVVTDFGVAKAVSEATSSQQLTAHGLAVGTPAYMSPEQVSGDQRTDHRADIYAVGILAYELLSGRTPFDGSTPQQVFAAHMIDPPDPLSMHRPSVTPELESIVMRCLAKNPADRWQTADELLHQLEELSKAPATTSSAPPASSPSPRHALRPWIGIAAPVVIVVVLAAVWPFVDTQDVTVQPVAPVQLTANPPERSLSSAAISPDGAYLAFTDPRGLHLRHLATNETRLLDVGVPVVPRTVSWFPDGARVLFLGADSTNEMSLWSVPIIGGRARRVMDHVLHAEVAPDGRQIAVVTGRGTRDRSLGDVWLMSPDGTGARRLAAPGPRESFWHLAWTHDSRAVAVGVWSDSARAIELVPVDGGTRRRLISDETLHQNWIGILPFAWCGNGRLVYARRDGPAHQSTSNVWMVDTDVAKGVVRGEPQRVTQWTGANVRELSVTGDCAKVVVLQLRNQPDVFVGELDASGRSFQTERKLTLDEREDFPTGWSADGQRLLIVSSRSGDTDVYAKDLRGGDDDDDLEALHRGPGSQGGSVYTPLSDAVLFMDRGDIWSVPLTGGTPRMMIKGPFAYVRCPRNSDRPCVAGNRAGDQYVFSSFDPTGSETREVARTAHRIPFTNWDLSPDGTEVAVVHNDDNTITIVKLDSGEQRVVRVNGWTNFEFVSWSAGNNGFFVTGTSALGTRYPALLRVDLDGSAVVLREHPNEWFLMPHASPDGRFVAYSKLSFHGNAWLVEGFR